VSWPLYFVIYVTLIPISWSILTIKSKYHTEIIKIRKFLKIHQKTDIAIQNYNIGFQKRATIIFFNSFIWAAILIAINYAWMASG
jgi:hypothetical protein